MSVFDNNIFLKTIKNALKATIYKSGTTVTILRGPLKGYRYVVNDNSGWSTIYGGWEPDAQKLYCCLVNSGYVVYDIGANTGVHSLLFSKLVGLTGKVYAIEPLPENANEIAQLMTINKMDNLKIIQKAISNFNGISKFMIGNTNKQGRIFCNEIETGSEITVDVTTLDSLLDNGHEMPNFIKIDVEGAEGAVLEGFQNWIIKTFPVFSIDLHTPEQDLKVGCFLKEHRYKVYRLNGQIGNNKNKLSEILSPVANLNSCWPDPQGIWGTVVALPEKLAI